MPASQDPFERGLFELDRYFLHFDEAALLRAIASFRAAARLTPGSLRHWSALGFALDAAERHNESLAAFRRAQAIDPEDEEVAVFVLTLISEAGAEEDAMAGVVAHAQRTGVDLEPLRRELTAAGMPTDSRTLIRNGFIHARNLLRSGFQTAIERAERRRDPAAWDRQLEREQRECLDAQQDLGRDVDPASVPDGMSELTPWAIRLGVGDDVCRALLWEQVTPQERSRLATLLAAQTGAIQVWLDGFDSDPMTPEAAVFMYLVLGWEEFGKRVP